MKNEDIEKLNNLLMKYKYSYEEELLHGIKDFYSIIFKEMCNLDINQTFLIAYDRETLSFAREYLELFILEEKENKSNTFSLESLEQIQKRIFPKELLLDQTFLNQCCNTNTLPNVFFVTLSYNDMVDLNMYFQKIKEMWPSNSQVSIHDFLHTMHKYSYFDYMLGTSILPPSFDVLRKTYIKDCSFKNEQDFFRLSRLLYQLDKVHADNSISVSLDNPNLYNRLNMLFKTFEPQNNPYFKRIALKPSISVVTYAFSYPNSTEPKIAGMIELKKSLVNGNFIITPSIVFNSNFNENIDSIYKTVIQFWLSEIVDSKLMPQSNFIEIFDKVTQNMQPLWYINSNISVCCEKLTSIVEKVIYNMEKEKYVQMKNIVSSGMSADSHPFECSEIDLKTFLSKIDKQALNDGVPFQPLNAICSLFRMENLGLIELPYKYNNKTGKYEFFVHSNFQSLFLIPTKYMDYLRFFTEFHKSVQQTSLESTLKWLYSSSDLLPENFISREELIDAYDLIRPILSRIITFETLNDVILGNICEYDNYPPLYSRNYMIDHITDSFKYLGYAQRRLS